MARRTPSSATATAPWGLAWLGGTVGLLLGLALFAPARWLAWAVERGSAQHVLLRAPRGSIWNGSAQLVLAGGAESRDATALPGRLDWRLRPALRGLDVAVQATCCMNQPWQVRAEPRWTGARVLISDGQSQWPAAVLAGLGTPWNTVQPEGTLALSAQGLSLEWISGRLLVAGRLQLQANDLSSRLSTLKPMGSYRLTLAGGGGDAPASLQLETISGALSLTGSGQWVGSRLRFSGEAAADPERVDALSNLLNIIGRRNGLRSIIQVG
ncbi:type II secretion system protein N [Pseudorhodoferax sp. Leaf274]|uniref:type II secretion system protein N n=1 Tax=Pseudorhodoferax sp. Leaf274 TaxID=1736318 RepID=UPI000702EF1F|nr:type II secretion system protein N [Pseudorhodoferax sp. Leaf274]KQP48597.1 general secretion pathway protein GspN [Pseudorhodoferax sp. Leaf274]